MTDTKSGSSFVVVLFVVVVVVVAVVVVAALPRQGLVKTCARAKK